MQIQATTCRSTIRWLIGTASSLSEKRSTQLGDKWVGSTRSGDYLEASQPSDVVALGASADYGAPDFAGAANADPMSLDHGSAPAPADLDKAIAPTVRYVKARLGDSVPGLAGSSDPKIVGIFARINGMDGGNSTIYPGRVYAIPGADSSASPDDAALGQHLLRQGVFRTDSSPSISQLIGYASPAAGGAILARGISRKDECIRQCTPLLKRYQPPGSDRNRWDFHKCVNQCMEGDGKTSPAPLPSTPSPAPPAHGRLPWWLMIPRLVPELPLVPA